MTAQIPEPAWCFTCHPDPADVHSEDCCCGVKARVKDSSDEGKGYG
jgi:hypothetical protein